MMKKKKITSKVAQQKKSVSDIVEEIIKETELDTKKRLKRIDTLIAEAKKQ